MAYTAPKGTYDVLPEESARWRAVFGTLLEPAERAGYRYVETPVFEDTGVFARAIGEGTDVVQKEMFSFTDKGDRPLTLRPEGTAGVVRAAVEHHWDRGALPVKVRYAGPMFRHEKPQAGRFRQFFQVGVEALGLDDPALDAEVVVLGVRAFEELGLTKVGLLLNSMGDETCRPAYVEELRRFLAAVSDRLCEECNRRRETNPLRVLDCRNEGCQAALAPAPVVVDHLCVPCKEHFDQVKLLLAACGVTWTDAPRLVRGLDYYRRTTFEFQHPLLGAQSAVGGGGRYDGLAESLGGPHLPGVGWALGVERTLLALEAEEVLVPAPPGCQVFVVPVDPAGKVTAVRIVDELRRAGVPADLAYGDRSLKGAMKAADRSGALVALLVRADGVELKHLDTGEQYPVPAAEAAARAAAAAVRDIVEEETPQ